MRGIEILWFRSTQYGTENSGLDLLLSVLRASGASLNPHLTLAVTSLVCNPSVYCTHTVPRSYLKYPHRSVTTTLIGNSILCTSHEKSSEISGSSYVSHHDHSSSISKSWKVRQPIITLWSAEVGLYRITTNYNSLYDAGPPDITTDCSAL